MATGSEPKDSPVDWVNDHIRQYVSTGGASGHDWNGISTLLLTTTGRRTGVRRRTALIYRQVGDDYVVVASRGGDDHHPAWYLNLAADPDVTVQVRDDVFDARASTAEGDERARLWPLMVEVFPNYDEFQKRTDRRIPVVVLRRV
ncbi:MAG TPA: nitroreductase family deazaflavin-dependent oxidoreductase [Pseudonocardiaceae bacterium]|nr:nitroreductase family deazaflavin-dependent oxidoreductase [Pseudonocardiaceae bacterium]